MPLPLHFGHAAMIVSFNLMSDYKRLIAFDAGPFPVIAPIISYRSS
jgi:hypothetical protein